MSSDVQTTRVRFGSVSEAYAWLDGRINYERALDQVTYDGRTFSLEPFRERLRRLGDPHRGRASIHIAGSRGKGSSALFLESALRASGLRTATYTSPHLREYRERIRIDGRPLEGEAFARLLEEIVNRLPPEEGAGSFKTVFEYLTALYFVAAREADVDWMIVETGLGGRLDSTNVLDAGPVLLTRIGLEHTHLLGGTLEAIAAEKAGILKEGGLAVAAAQAQAPGLPTALPMRELPGLPGAADVGSDRAPAEGVFEARAEEVGAPLFRAPELCPLLEAAFHPRGVRLRFRFRGEPLDLDLPLLGAFLPENLQGVLGLLDRLEAAGRVRLAEAGRLAEALERTALPGRLQRIESRFMGKELEWIVDGAHCPTGAAAVARSLELHLGEEGRERGAIAVVGMMRDKDHGAFFRALAQWPGWRAVVCYRVEFPRALEADRLAEAARPFFGNVHSCATLPEALELSARLAEEKNRVVALGTIYSVAPIQDWIAAHDAGRPEAQAPTQAEPQTDSGRP